MIVFNWKSLLFSSFALLFFIPFGNLQICRWKLIVFAQSIILFTQILITCRMSMFFFRLHNLQREEANKKKKKIELRQRRGGRVFRRLSRPDLNHLTAPSRLFEKTPMNPSDSLDEIALQIPRFDLWFLCKDFLCFFFSEKILNQQNYATLFLF